MAITTPGCIWTVLSIGRLARELKVQGKKSPELREANVLKNADISWLHQAFDYPSHGAHRTHIPCHIYLSSPMGGVIEVADLQAGDSTGVYVIDMFEGYYAYMIDLLIRLRATADRR